MRLFLGAAAAACAISLAVHLPLAAAAGDEPGPGPRESTTVVLTATGGHDGTDSRLLATVLGADESPLAEVPVRLERRVGGTWRVIGEPVADADGVVTQRALIWPVAANNRFRAAYVGDDTHAASRSATTARLEKRTGVLRLTGPHRVVDGRRITLEVRSRTRSGDPVAGEVRVLRRTRGDRWRQVHVLTTGDHGKARIAVRPRVDTRWRVTSEPRDWVSGARSRVLRVDNLPPTAPVELPAAAPTPRVSLPPQAGGTGRGAHPVVTSIPAGVWRQMTGRSWHAGCPVGRAGLRLLRINYWGYDGYRHRGELVAAASAIGVMARALTRLYEARLPIRSMYRVDRFGWSSKLQGADDYASMAAGNTSAFNCRQVVNRPGVRSPHSYGRALDLNTWENPYRSPTGLVPNTWWQGHSHPRVAWRSSSHRVVRILTSAGFRWTYGLGDTQHFDVGGGYGRLAHRRCGGAVCD
ncbi:hypothetical protein BH09ACT12_BH09ACT12_04610 [soil metagenome]